MKEINLLWADSEHLWCWKPSIDTLEKYYAFKVTQTPFIEEQELLKKCEGQDAVIIHCGTLHPMAVIKELLVNIKTMYPNIKIGLDTNVVHPDLEEVTDFYIDKPITTDDLKDVLRQNIK